MQLLLSTRLEFREVVTQTVADFASNRLFQAIDLGKFSIADYHSFLRMIFHQTFNAGPTFALAGANCDSKFHEIRAYLLDHAVEEKDHWKWVLEDLQSSGYKGNSPLDEFPSPAAQAFIAFNYFTAYRCPIARLGTASVLEGIGATNGKKYALRLVELLGLKPHQLKFILGHGDTDVGHTQDIEEVLSAANLTPVDWGWLTHAAKTAGVLYRNMYEEAMLWSPQK